MTDILFMCSIASFATLTIVGVTCVSAYLLAATKREIERLWET